MQTRVSTKGQIVLPAPIRRRLGIRSGDPLNVAVEEDRIVLTPVSEARYRPEIVEDPITGLPMLSLGPDAPVLTSEMVRALLVDFP
jgi:AbrB family looped-hinge helix DNA binding protein